ncbi:hypothetical protein [Marinobacter sp.]|uniref:hypothetical protein n=1 Tax=Marinobacter sp. TaxID=50741 RepID=UPI003F99D187
MGNPIKLNVFDVIFNAMFALVVITIPLTAYFIPYTPLSLNKGVLVLVFGLSLFYLSKTKEVHKSSAFYLFPFFVLMLQGIILFVLSAGATKAVFSYIVNFLVLLMLVFSADVYARRFSDSAFRRMQAIFFASIIIMVLFFLYQLYFSVFFGVFPEQYPFGSLTRGAEKNHHMFQMGGSESFAGISRITLPFARPQDFGLFCTVIACLYGVFSVVNHGTEGKFRVYATLLLSFVLVVFSGSRSILFPFLLCFVFSYSWVFYRRKKFLVQVLFLVLPFIIFGIVAFSERISESRVSSLDFAGHILFRLKSLIEFMSLDFFRLMLGYGLVDYYELWRSGAMFHNPHMTIITTLFSYGMILGLAFYAFMLALPLMIVRRCRLGNLSDEGKVLQLFFPSFVFLSLLFYDFTNFFPYFCVMGVAFIVIFRGSSAAKRDRVEKI